MSYSVEPADLPRAREEILQLWAANRMNIPEAKFDWLYLRSPHGAAQCWMARHCRDGVVGMVTVFPRMFRVAGVLVRGGVVGDFGVLPKHRAFGPALALQRAAIAACDAGGFDFLYGIPNHQSRSMLLRAGYEPVADVFWMTKILRVRPILEQRGTAGRWPVWLTSLADAVLRGASLDRWYPTPREFRFTRIEEGNSALDELCRRRSREGWSAERTPAYLDWRHSPAAPRPTLRYALLDSDERPLAYTSLYLRDNRVHISDLFAQSQRAARVLLLELLRWSRRRAFDAVSIVFVGDGLRDALGELGFFHRPSGTKLLLYAPKSSPLLSQLRSSPCFLTEADTDV